MEIYVFSSTNLVNIWAGVGARRWAISPEQAQMGGTLAKARTLRVGSLGILYCVATQSLTTPFLVTSAPDPSTTVSDVWPEEWHFPFGIHPLGSPHRHMGKADIARLPAVVASGRQWNNVIRTQGQFVFQSTTIGSDDWEVLFSQLGSLNP
jgi:hypothetical protein